MGAARLVCLSDSPSVGKLTEGQSILTHQIGVPPGGARKAPTHLVEGGITSGLADIEAAPQVAAGPLAVAEGTLLPIRLPGERGVHGSAGVEDSLHQGAPEWWEEGERQEVSTCHPKK